MPTGLLKVAAYHTVCTDMALVHVASLVNGFAGIQCVPVWLLSMNKLAISDCRETYLHSHPYLTGILMQGQDPVNFDLDDYNALEIRASASTINEYIAGVRMKNQKSGFPSESEYKFSNMEDKVSVELPRLEHDPNRELLPSEIDRFSTLSRHIFLVKWCLAHIRIVYGNFVGTLDLYERYWNDLYYEESKISRERFHKEIDQVFCLLKIHTTKSREDNVGGFTGIKYASQERDNIGQTMDKLFTG